MEKTQHGDLGATSPGGTAQETQSVFTVQTSVRRAQDGVLRDSAWTFALFVVATLFATAPRWIALLGISWLVPHAPMPAALDDFKSIWTACPPKSCVHQRCVQLQTDIHTDGCLISEMGTPSHRIKDIHQLAMISD